MTAFAVCEHGNINGCRKCIVKAILEKLPEYKENLTPYAEENSSKTLDKLIEQSEIVGYNQCLQDIKKLLEEL